MRTVSSWCRAVHGDSPRQGLAPGWRALSLLALCVLPAAVHGQEAAIEVGRTGPYPAGDGSWTAVVLRRRAPKPCPMDAAAECHFLWLDLRNESNLELSCQAEVTYYDGGPFPQRGASNRPVSARSAYPLVVVNTGVKLDAGVRWSVECAARPAARGDGTAGGAAPPGAPRAPTGAPSAGQGPGRDISQLTPQERADRLFSRVMEAVDAGDRQVVNQLGPLAVEAFQQLPRLDADAHLRRALIFYALLREESALREVSAIESEAPTHLFVPYIKARTALQQGARDQAMRAYGDLVAWWDAEQARGRPEYRAHAPLLEEALQAAMAMTGRRPVSRAGGTGTGTAAGAALGSALRGARAAPGTSAPAGVAPAESANRDYAFVVRRRTWGAPNVHETNDFYIERTERLPQLRAFWRRFRPERMTSEEFVECIGQKWFAIVQTSESAAAAGWACGASTREEAERSAMAACEKRPHTSPCQLRVSGMVGLRAGGLAFLDAFRWQRPPSEMIEATVPDQDGWSQGHADHNAMQAQCTPARTACP